VHIIMDHIRYALIALRFFSRIPVPALPGETDPHAPPDIKKLTQSLWLTGLLLGLIAACGLLATAFMGLPLAAVAIVTIAVQIVSTGAFHEDGLADTADGFGGGFGKERKLEIMKDSRLGTYGACALFLTLSFKCVLLYTLLEYNILIAGLFIIIAASFSRVAALRVAHALPPARDDGAAYAAGRPDTFSLCLSNILAFASGLCLCLVAHERADMIMILALSLLACHGVVALVIALSKQQISGQTGDVAGAAQQMGELAILLVATIYLM
jgi:adenosylcobinamide-GDP ribazoletransferase